MTKEAGHIPTVIAIRASEDLCLPQVVDVVSCYRHSVLARDRKGSLVTLLCPGRLAGPKSAVVEELPTAAGSVIVVERATACAPQEVACERFPVSLGAEQPPFSLETISLMERFLTRFAPVSSLWHQAATDVAVESLLKRHKEALLSGAPLPALCGLGVGLTPSSDDYLLGALAYGRLCGAVWYERLAYGVEEQLQACSPVSRCMLAAGLEGKFPEVVLNFLTHPGKKSSLAFLGHGATSGFDVVFGILSAALWGVRE